MISKSNIQLSSEAGVSLAELVMTLACGMILAVAAVPNVFRLQQEWTLLGGARLLESSLQWGRMHAISANTSVMLEVDEGGRSFYWEDAANGERFETTVRYLPGSVRIVDSPRRALRFYPRGNAAPAGTYRLQGDSGAYSIVVNIGGRIRLQKD